MAVLLRANDAAGASVCRVRTDDGAFKFDQHGKVEARRDDTLPVKTPGNFEIKKTDLKAARQGGNALALYEARPFLSTTFIDEAAVASAQISRRTSTRTQRAATIQSELTSR
jgi:hypothetical protein